MKKRIISLLLALTLCMAFALPVFASEAEELFVYDDAELLSASQAAALEKKLSKLSEKYEAQIIVMTIDTLDGEGIESYANDIYDTLKLGYGENRDGVLLVISMDPREYWILSNGFAGEAITSSEGDAIGEAFKSDLSDGNYADAFNTFADQCEYYLEDYLTFDPGFHFLLSLGIGLVVALIVTGIWKGQLKSVHRQNQASVYVKPGSLQITQSGDYFMYRNVIRTEKLQNNSSGRSSSGGSRSGSGGSF